MKIDLRHGVHASKIEAKISHGKVSMLWYSAFAYMKSTWSPSCFDYYFYTSCLIICDGGCSGATFRHYYRNWAIIVYRATDVVYLRGPPNKVVVKFATHLHRFVWEQKMGYYINTHQFFHVQSACPYFDTHTSILTSSLICFPKITQSTIYCLSHEGDGGGQKSKEATHSTRRGQFCIFQKKFYYGWKL